MLFTLQRGVSTGLCLINRDGLPYTTSGKFYGIFEFIRPGVHNNIYMYISSSNTPLLSSIHRLHVSALMGHYQVVETHRRNEVNIHTYTKILKQDILITLNYNF
jgi:hypothetical protein